MRLLKTMILNTVILFGLGLSITPVMADDATKTQSLYMQSCVTCHGVGVLGAPKTGDKVTWAKRATQGMPTLVSHVKNGYKNMPARGLCDVCTEQDYEALTKMMMK